MGGPNGTDATHQLRRYARLPQDQVIVPRDLVIAVLAEVEDLRQIIAAQLVPQVRVDFGHERPSPHVRPTCRVCGQPHCEC